MKIEPQLPCCTSLEHDPMNGRTEAEYICDMCGYNFCISCVEFNIVPGKHFCKFKCSYDVRNIIKNKIDEWIIAFKESQKVGSRN